MKVDINLDDFSYIVLNLDDIGALGIKARDALEGTEYPDSWEASFGLSCSFAFKMVRMVITDEIATALTELTSNDVGAILDELMEARQSYDPVKWQRYAGDLWRVVKEARDSLKPFI